VLLDRRQRVRDALVAVDAGHAGVECLLVRIGRAPVLLGVVHRREVMAIAALLAVVKAYVKPAIPLPITRKSVCINIFFDTSFCISIELRLRRC